MNMNNTSVRSTYLVKFNGRKGECMNFRFVFMAVPLIFSLASCAVSAQSDKEVKPGKHWLLGVETDAERFGRLETYLRGFDQPMWEVGHRYEIVYEAILDRNYELASYHWKKIKTTIRNGYMKRPARQTSADSMFLDSGVWASLDKALLGSDDKEIKDSFAVARKTCMACHVVEKVPFMNDQKIFRRTEAFSE